MMDKPSSQMTADDWIKWQKYVIHEDYVKEAVQDAETRDRDRIHY